MHSHNAHSHSHGHDNDGSTNFEFYHNLDKTGEIYTNKGNKTLYIATAEYIYLYSIDQDTLLPHVQYAIRNYMNCTSVVASRVGTRYMITFSLKETNFDIIRKKYFHQFLIPIKTRQCGCEHESNMKFSYDGAAGLEVLSKNIFVIAKNKTIEIFSSITYHKMFSLVIETHPHNCQNRFER